MSFTAQNAASPATTGLTSAGMKHLGEHRCKVHAFNACTHDDGTDGPPNRACEELDGKPTSPGYEVPNDCADQSGKNEGRADGDLLLVDDAARDGLRHLGRQKSTDKIERSAAMTAVFGLKALLAIGRHGIGGVVKSVREVERESRDDDEHHHNQSCRM